jgi:serine/threonine protein kinase
MTNEVRILTQLNHPNIVKVYEVIEENNAVYIVMEQCEDDLCWFTEAGPCGEKKSLEIMKQIITGYKELLRQGIMHRDLKPANILIKYGGSQASRFWYG